MRLNRPSQIRLLVVVLLCGVVAVSLANPRPARSGGTLLAAWVQLGPDGLISARVVTTADGCPTIALDRARVLMLVRATPSAAFPVLVCESAIPPETRAASVEGLRLPLPVAEPRRIAVVGDTGCRVSEYEGIDQLQACDDPVAWPWASIAQRAANARPDLVIHGGDYLYRESPCPASSSGCAGSPWGYTWAAMAADFFDPAASLLRAAPWVFVRGNHEVCERNGEGWIRLLDPRPYTGACETYTDPYAVPLGERRLLVFDSANASDTEAKPDAVAAYRAQMPALRERARHGSWLLSHRPLWAIGREGDDNGVEKLFFDNPTLQAATGNDLPADVELVVSGHLHLMQALNFGGTRPPQLIIGTSGTSLDAAPTTPLTGQTVGGAVVSASSVVDRFGYLLMEPSGLGWAGALRSPTNAPELVCTLVRRSLICVPPN